MKKFILAFAVASVFAACEGKKETLESGNTGILIDTSTLYNNSASTDMALMAEKQVLPAYNDNARSGNNNNTTRTTRKVNRSASTRNAGTSDNSTTAVQPVKKKGWSKAAKGAVIGGVGGAVVGAVVSKKKVKGAIIGGVVGAAGGYILGRSKDKKEGRVQ